jgi:hypothetical protein
MKAKTSLPAGQTLRLPAEFGTRDIYEYRVPLGLALMQLDTPPGGLDLLERMTEVQEQEKVKSGRRSTTLAAALAVFMLLVLIVAAYFIDVASEKRLTALVNQPTFKNAAERQKLLKTMARNRPDILGLLTAINAGENKGIVLDEFHFKKGQLISITGQADNMEQMWKYEASLAGHKDLRDVETPTHTQDSKTKKIKFTMVFHYKNFTKKGESL